MIVSQPGQGIGEDGVSGASIQGELNGQAESSIPFNLWVTDRRGAGPGGAASVRSSEELGQTPQAGVCRLQVPGARRRGPLAVPVRTRQVPTAPSVWPVGSERRAEASAGRSWAGSRRCPTLRLC